MARRPPRRSRGDGGAATSEYFASAPPRILAHRGLALAAPENTLLAFLSALALGLTHLETDVQVSRDGVAVLAHDVDLARLVGRASRISDLTVAELKLIDLGAGQTFATLAEALDTFPEACFNIDLKAPGSVGPAVAAILAADATPRVLVTSFSESRRRAAIRELPGVATSASAATMILALAAAKLGVRPLVRRALAAVHAVQVPEAMLGIRVVTPRTIRAFHDAGVEVHVWTVNEASDIERLLDLGVDGIVTDRSDLALQIVKKRLIIRE
ncbi:glycerophosphodiester phosphodiesterase family protein [Lacisediminihabitans profunda]|uniref:Glycerophosphodiester phosphodiesterase n=1 Tax=Lacisediminihabitans profunda TaxID=2594790 RepID=A0A5C8UW37_9MICO|nr:glycerophosphodiester phosphodiesterase family protein [Lacisediminihabitans profunda]TXN31847.1 glycerophosphodiester phosphodiesterase [Lacisediminihabitans profunda]